MILALLVAAQVVGVLEFRDKVPRRAHLDAPYLSDAPAGLFSGGDEVVCLTAGLSLLYWSPMYG